MIEVELKNMDKILIYGHRGAGFLAPENTMASFELAYEIGVDTIEFDIHMTRDGALVVMHDHDVSRTTDGQGYLNQMTMWEVKGLDAGIKFGEAYKNERVPTLGEVLDWAKDRIQLIIEIKGHPQPAQGIEEALVEEVHAAGMTDQVLVKSFFHECVRLVHEIDPAIPTGILTASALVDPVGAAMEACADSFRNYFAYWTPDAVKALRTAGLQVSAWGVNDEDALERIVALGVDSIGTDRPKLALAYLREHGLSRKM